MAYASDIHPVRWNYEGTCSFKDAGYRQLVKKGDITEFQFRSEICPPELNLVSNPVFSTTADWLIANPLAASIDTGNGKGVKVPSAGVGQIYQNIVLPNARHIVLRFTVNVTFGACRVTLGTYIEDFIISGTYERIIECQSVSYLLFSGDFAANFWFTDVQMFALNEHFAFRVLDQDGTVVRTLDSVADSLYFDFTRGWLSVRYDWTDALGSPLPDGCYYFELADPCDCGNFGFVAEDFVTVPNQFSGGPLWTFGGGVAQYSGSSTSSAKMSNVFCEGKEYTITYTLSGMDANSKLWVRVGSTLGTLRTADGTYTDTITANTPDFYLVGGSTGGVTTFSMSSLTVRPTELSYGFTSNWFALKTNIACSFLVSVCCDTDNLQAGWNDTGFSPKVRLFANYGQGGHRADSESYKDSGGTKSNYYYSGDKYRDFAYSSSEYIHDFMAHLKGYDHVYIDGVEVYVEDEEPPSIAWVKGYDIGERIFALSLKTVNITKRRISSAINGCSRGGIPIEADGGGIVGGGTGVIGGIIFTETQEELLTG